MRETIKMESQSRYESIEKSWWSTCYRDGMIFKMFPPTLHHYIYRYLERFPCFFRDLCNFHSTHRWDVYYIVLRRFVFCTVLNIWKTYFFFFFLSSLILFLISNRRRCFIPQTRYAQHNIIITRCWRCARLRCQRFPVRFRAFRSTAPVKRCGFAPVRNNGRSGDG